MQSSSPYNHKDYESWSTTEVVEWLTRIGFERHAEQFNKRGVDGAALKSRQLKDMKEITNDVREQEELMKAIEMLRTIPASEVGCKSCETPFSSKIEGKFEEKTLHQEPESPEAEEDFEPVAELPPESESEPLLVVLGPDLAFASTEPFSIPKSIPEKEEVVKAKPKKGISEKDTHQEQKVGEEKIDDNLDECSECVDCKGMFQIVSKLNLSENSDESEPNESKHFVFQGKIYCIEGYMRIGPRCHYCHETIFKGKILLALGYRWHSHHLFCAGPCGRPLPSTYISEEVKGVNYQKYLATKKEKKADEAQKSDRREQDPEGGDQRDKSVPFCEDCHEALFAKYCDVCGLRIKREAISGDDKHYHTDCYHCCVVPCTFTNGLTAGERALVLKDRKFYCEQHYYDTFTAKCRVCGGNVIEGIKIEGGSYHKKCIRCEDCSIPLNSDAGEVFSSMYDGKLSILCKEHFEAKVLPHCDSCNKPMYEGIEIHGKTFHKECIRCQVCNCLLRAYEPTEEEKMIPQAVVPDPEDGKVLIFCKEHYEAKVFPRCDSCGKTLYDGVEIYEKPYHKECIRCQTCNCLLRVTMPKTEEEEKLEQAVIPKTDDGKFSIFCKEHYEAKVLPRCDSCGKALYGGIEINGKLYHKECIRCQACNCLLRVTDPTTEEEEKIEQAVSRQGEDGQDVLYCKADYIKLFFPSCPQCNQPITQGKVIKVEEITYHAECFVCFTCKKPFPDGECTREKTSGKFYCLEHSE